MCPRIEQSCIEKLGRKYCSLYIQCICIIIICIKNQIRIPYFGPKTRFRWFCKIKTVKAENLLRLCTHSAQWGTSIHQISTSGNKGDTALPSSDSFFWVTSAHSLAAHDRQSLLRQAPPPTEGLHVLRAPRDSEHACSTHSEARGAQRALDMRRWAVQTWDFESCLEGRGAPSEAKSGGGRTQDHSWKNFLPVSRATNNAGREEVPVTLNKQRDGVAEGRDMICGSVRKGSLFTRTQPWKDREVFLPVQVKRTRSR